MNAFAASVVSAAATTFDHEFYLHTMNPRLPRLACKDISVSGHCCHLQDEFGTGSTELLSLLIRGDVLVDPGEETGHGEPSIGRRLEDAAARHLRKLTFLVTSATLHWSLGDHAGGR